MSKYVQDLRWSHDGSSFNQLERQCEETKSEIDFDQMDSEAWDEMIEKSQLDVMTIVRKQLTERE